jgi:hypothetical protein
MWNVETVRKRRNKKAEQRNARLKKGRGTRR